MTARANKNAVKTNQTVGLLKPESTFSAGKVRVNTSRVMAITTLTPIGTGRATSATMVAAKIASRCRCPGSNPGRGRKYSKAPGTSTTAQRHEAGGRGRVKARTCSVLVAKCRVSSRCDKKSAEHEAP